MNILQCQICEKTFANTAGLGSHLKCHKIGLRQHYVKYFKQKNEGICKECGKETTWNRDKNKYRVFCSSSCAAIYRNRESVTPESLIKRSISSSRSNRRVILISLCFVYKIKWITN